LSHSNIVGFPACCGQLGNDASFQIFDIAVACPDGIADFIEQAIEARGFGALGLAQVTVA
jgi:hypothetical protein